MEDWQVRAVCPCGWNIEATHGNIWFAQKRYPVCPECGSDSFYYLRKVQRWTPDGFEEKGAGPLQIEESVPVKRSYGVLIVLAVIAALAFGFFAVPYLLPMKYDHPVDAHRS